MHGDEGAAAARGSEHAQILPVVQMQRIVGEKNLQAADALRDDLRNLLPDHIVGGVGDDLVEAVIDHRPLRPPAIFRERLKQATTLELVGESDDGGGAAGKAGAAAALPGFLIGIAAFAKLFDMAMRIDAAGQHQQAAGVKRVGTVEAFGQRGDAAVADADIGAHRVGASDDGAATHHEIEAGHADSPFCSTATRWWPRHSRRTAGRA